MFHAMMMAALLTVGQPPKPQVVVPPKPADPLAEAVTRALQTHPDIRVAEAEVQVATAKLAQAKLKISQQVTAAHADRDRLLAMYQAESEAYRRMQAVRGAISDPEKETANAALVGARANLAKAEAELKALVGPPAPVVNSIQFLDVTGKDSDRLLESTILLTYEKARRQHLVLEYYAPTAPGSPAEKLKAALDKPVKLAEMKAIGIKAGYEAVLKAAGVDVHLRVPAKDDPAEVKDVPHLTLPAGEYPLGTWFELIADAYTQVFVDLPPRRYELYLREYGLLVSEAKLAPPGAITVSDLWKQLRAEKAKAAQVKEKK